MAMLNNQMVNATYGMRTSFLECSNLMLLHVMFPEKRSTRKTTIRFTK